MEAKSTIPDWLNRNFIITALQKGNLSKIDVQSFSVNPAVSAGNNYCCTVLRVHVQYEEDNEYKKISFIVKSPLPDGPGKDLIERLGFIEKESFIYEELIPLMKNMLGYNIAPQNYISQVPGVIILEDLKENGYTMCDKLEQLDFGHCNAVMKNLSKFHALSFHIYKQNPEIIEKAGRESVFFNNTTPDSTKWFFDAFDFFAANIEKWEGFESLPNFIKKNGNALWDNLVTIFNNEKNIRVLNHGDAWTNNILFKHDKNGEISDVKLIDFQVCRFASPGIDITMFILTSAQEDVKLHRLPELYATYLHSFNATLKSIGSDERLTLEQLLDELKYVESIYFCFLSCYLPFILCEKDNIISFDEKLDHSEASEENKKNKARKILNGKQFMEVTKFTLHKLNEQGYFENFNVA